MKKTIFYSASAAIAALAFASCAMEEEGLKKVAMSSFEKPVTVCFTTDDEGTKTAFGEFDESTQSYHTFWTASDNQIAMSLNMNVPVNADVIKSEAVSNNAEFRGTFEDTGKPYKFYAFTPASCVYSLSESRNGWLVTIPTVQMPREDGLSCDEAAMLLYAESETFEALPQEPVKMHFSHATTYCRLTLKNLAAALASHDVSDAEIMSVDLTFSTPVAGEWYVNTTSGSIEAREASHTVTIIKSVEDASQPAEFWLAMAPCSLNGQSVKVTVNTDKGRLSRDYTYGDRTYEAGAVNKLSLDMTKNSTFDASSITIEEDVYEAVNSISEISINDEVIFIDDVDPSPAYAMANTTAGTNGFNIVAKDATDGFTYSTDDGYIRLPEGSKVMVWTIASKSGSNVSFKNANNRYLSNTQASNTSHYPSLSTSAKQFTLYFFGDNTLAAYYTAKSGRTTYNFSLYCDNSYFKYYTSTGTNVYYFAMFKKKTIQKTIISDLDSDPILEKEDYGAYLSEGNTVHTPGTSQLSRQYTASNVTFAILYPAQSTVYEFIGIPTNAAKGDEFTLQLCKISGSKRTDIGTFRVTVAFEDGAKLWLTDFNGNGFIVKR